MSFTRMFKILQLLIDGVLLNKNKYTHMYSEDYHAFHVRYHLLGNQSWGPELFYVMDTCVSFDKVPLYFRLQV